MNKYHVYIELAYYLVLVPVIFGLNLLKAFGTVHVLSCMLVEILNHTTAVHVSYAVIESSMPKLHRHTFPIHISIDLVSVDVKFIVLAEVICHTIPLHVSISSTNSLKVNFELNY